MDPWGDRRFQAGKNDCLEINQSNNQPINQEEEPWAERRTDREIAFVCGDHHRRWFCVVVMM